MEYPSSIGTVSYAYDAEGRLEELTDWDSRVTSFAYDALDRVETITRPDDLVTSFTYDALSRVTQIEHAYDGTPEITVDYTWDEVGNIETRTDDLGTATFTYDDLDRLTAADYPGANDHAWTYDAVGNLLSITDPGGTTNHTYDDGNRIDDVGFTYDDNGSLLTDGVRTFTYDAFGRLTGVTASGLSAAYVLDGDGNRVSQIVDTVTTDFDLDLRGLATPLVAGTRAYLPGMPSMGYLEGSDWYGGMADLNGSVLAHIDDVGSVSAITRYDPYGNPRLASSLPDGFGYTGEWADASGLVNLRARAYDPSLGAFLSRDSFPGVATMPLTGNRHAYGSGNPLRYMDPSGHFIAAFMGTGPSPDLCLLYDTCEDKQAAIDALGLDPACVATWGWEGCLWVTTQSPSGETIEARLDALGTLVDAVDAGRAVVDLLKWLLGDEEAAGRALMNLIGTAPGGGNVLKRVMKHLPKPGVDIARRLGVTCARSFSGDTGVLMADGTTRPISLIEVGDRVVAVDPETGERTIETVLAVWSHEDELVELRVEDGSIITTPGHPFWDTTDGRWEEARELLAGEHLLAADGDRVRVLGLVSGSQHDGIAWNLTVSGPHTYHVVVGDDAVLVHNACPTVDEILENPRVLEGLTLDEVRGGIEGTPGWISGPSSQGTHKGLGWKLSEVGANGVVTGRQIRWHPGGGVHGDFPYWTVSDGRVKWGVIPAGQ